MSDFNVVLSPCVGVKAAACVTVCPCDCFYDAGDRLVIHPEECIICGLCETQCPMLAIVPNEEVPKEEQASLDFAHSFFKGKTREELDQLNVTG